MLVFKTVWLLAQRLSLQKNLFFHQLLSRFIIVSRGDVKINLECINLFKTWIRIELSRVQGEGNRHGSRRDGEDKGAAGGRIEGESEVAQAGASAVAVPQDRDGQERQWMELRGGQELRSARHPPDQKIHLSRVSRTVHSPLEGLIQMKLMSIH